MLGCLINFLRIPFSLISRNTLQYMTKGMQATDLLMRILAVAVATKVVSLQLFGVFLYAVALRFPLCKVRLLKIKMPRLEWANPSVLPRDA